MSTPTDEEIERVNEYLKIIEDRIIDPLLNTGVQRYCTATLLILYPAIDGLGKLHHPDGRVGSNARIRDFLDYMGGGYSAVKEELLDLRNALLHNAINVESFLSNADLPAGPHLAKMGTSGYVYVDTPTMCRDFRVAFNRFRNDLLNNPTMMTRAAARLKTATIDPWDVTTNGPSPSQAPIAFVKTKS